MTPQERDSLLKITKPGDTINIDQARTQNIGTSVGEMIGQLRQDMAFSEGNPLNLDTLNHIFSDSIPPNLAYRIVQYDKDTLAIDSVGYSGKKSWNYVSELFPIGTKGHVFLQVKAAIPWFEFVWHQLWDLITSLCIMLVTFICLAIQLIEIKRQNELLRKRKATINGTIHDLKSPLNSVVTMLSWFKATENDPQKRKMIETGLSSIKHLVYTIESLLVIARKDEHRIVLNKTRVDVPKLVEKTNRNWHFSIGEIRTYPYHKSIAGGLHRTGRQDVHRQRHTEPAGERLEILGRGGGSDGDNGDKGADTRRFRERQWLGNRSSTPEKVVHPILPSSSRRG